MAACPPSPSRPVADKDMKPGVTKFIAGGYLYLPRRSATSRRTRPSALAIVGQLLGIDMPKLPEYMTEARPIEHC